MPVTIKSSLSSIQTDPIRNFKFIFEIHNPGKLGKGKNGDEITRLGFMSVGGINLSTEVIPYRQGGYNTTPQKLPGQTDFSPVTLSRGVLLGTNQNWNWTKQIFDVLQGASNDLGGPGHDFRTKADLKVLDHPVTEDGKNTPVKLWVRFYNCWLSTYALSDLDAGGNGFMIEQLTLIHEGFEVAWAGTNKKGDVDSWPGKI